uniref:ATP synthase F0 subunit 8 n=1 Tax=Diceroprocta semicincta TaxID=946270 RepID=A0A088DP57_9HEMI|nr:ATP synthase F0 subunit 8 [Diceroprocta semicincta]
MPQMSPMYWLLLMIYFIILMMVLLTFIYFTFCNKPTIKFMDLKKKYVNWLW